MPTSTDDSECVGKYIMNDGRLIKSAKSKIVPEEAKNQFLQFLLTQSVPKKYSTTSKLTPEQKKERIQDKEAQIKIEANKLKGKNQINSKRIIPNVYRRAPQPPPALNVLVSQLNSKLKEPGIIPTQAAGESIGIAVKLILRTIIEQAKKFKNHGNRIRMVPEDIDLAFSLLKIDYELVFPVLKPTPYSDRPFWGRRVLTQRFKTIPANSTDIVSNERFCDSIVIRDHWLCVDGVQPCVPENVVPTEVRFKFQQQIEEKQRMVAIGIKKDQNFEKRQAKQFFSLEHQVLFNEIVNVLANGTPLERQKVLQFIENDTGLQFLVGRFVVFVAEGVRVNIAARNVKSLANLIKLTWSLMKNPKTKVEKYLFELVPSLISCTVVKSMMPLTDFGKFLGKNKLSDQLTQEDEERIIRDISIEFRVRECSSRILAILCEQCPNQLLSIRIIRILKQILTTKTDPSTLYGVLCIFFAFGYLTIKMLVIPRLHDIYCGLMNIDDYGIAVKSSSTKFRKITAEAEIKRMEIARNRVVELIMKILYEYEAYEPNRRVVEEEIFINLYGEFGAMFYRHLIETGKIDDNGKVLVTRPSLLKGKLEKKKQKEEEEIKRRYTNKPVEEELDEDMLENLLDDSDRPWVEVAKKVEMKEEEEENNEKIEEFGSKLTFFGNPKLVIIRRAKENYNQVEYLRPLELAHMPSVPTVRVSKRQEKAGTVRSSRSAMSVDDFALALTVSKEPGELLKKYLTRPTLQAAAVTYGRSLEVSESGRERLDKQISDAASKLSNIRLRNCVANYRNPVSGGRDEMNRGKFLVPSTERGNRL